MKPKNPKSRPKTSAKPAAAFAGVCHHLQTYAAELGKDPETIKKALIRTDYHPVPGQPIPLKEIIAALFGEKYVEEVRAMRLDNEERERKAKERDGVLVQMPEVEALLTEWVVLPLSSALASMPAEISPLCAGPEAARKAIDTWIENKLKPMLRAKLPVGKKP